MKLMQPKSSRRCGSESVFWNEKLNPLAPSPLGTGRAPHTAYQTLYRHMYVYVRNRRPRIVGNTIKSQTFTADCF